MSLTSMKFLLFIALAAVVYYSIPKKYQWVCLLVFSYVYYLSAGPILVLFLLSTTLSTYGGGRLLAWIGEQQTDKRTAKRKKRMVLIAVMVLNFGILGVLKYTNFVIENMNALFHGHITFQMVLLPLGISFYTFQSMGYLADVYWGKVQAERNVFRFALFVSFFPQLLQGPIARFGRLANQLYAQHTFNLTRTEYALQLMLWGFFKKMVLADRAGILVDQVFSNYEQYHGITVIAAILGYSIQLYGDFSGGIDVVTGAAALFGIQLDANFKRPYFAISITDFWHRWHITLGTWMKDYIFYPLSLSKWMARFGKRCRRMFGKKTGRVLPICLANIIVFLVVGIWHGAAWKYIVYGLYNGLLIALASLFAPVFLKLFRLTGINPKSGGWHVVRILRTFLLVNISWYFDMAASLSVAFAMMKNTVRDFTFRTLTDGSLLALGLDKEDYLILLMGCLVLFVVSLLQEKGMAIRETLAARPLAVRWALYLLLLFSLPLLGNVTLGGGFIYAQF